MVEESDARWPWDRIDARQEVAVQYRYQQACYAYWRHVYGDEQRRNICGFCNCVNGLCPEGARLNQACRDIEDELEYIVSIRRAIDAEGWP
jgi:hypothetical protein